MTATEFFLDTNILVRLLANDHPEHGELARALLVALEDGTTFADISETVIFECVFVMTKTYGQSRQFVIDSLSSLLALDAIRTPLKPRLLEALGLWGRYGRISFADAYHLVLASNTPHKRIASFDKSMDNVLADVVRIEQLP